MIRIPAAPLLLVLTLPYALCVSAGQLRWNADSLSLRLEEVKQLPAPPAGVTELKFTELYKMPVGPRGLELTDTVRALAGKRVRVLGFMVRQAKGSPGVAILSPYEIATNEQEYGVADDLPPSLIYVKVSRYEDIAVPYTPGPLLLTGVLEIGRHEESDGRFSEIRLLLDEPAQDDAPPAQTTADSSAAASSPAKS